MSDLLDEVYKATILEHSRRPRNHGPLDPRDAEARGHNPLCGDDVTVYARLDDGGGKIDAVTFEGKGCAISQSSASLMTEAVAGKSLAEAKELVARFDAMVKSTGTIEIDDEELGSLAALAGVRKLPMRVKCATLAWRALENALAKASAARAAKEGDA